MKSTPNGISGPGDTYTDVAGDVQWDLTVARFTTCCLFGDLHPPERHALRAGGGGGSERPEHNLNSVNVNAEYHFGNRVSTSSAGSTPGERANPRCTPRRSVSGSANGSPDSEGFIANLSWWPTQNLQFFGAVHRVHQFNGGTTDYDGSGRDAASNNTVFLLARFVF